MRSFILADNQDLTKSGFLYILNHKRLTSNPVKEASNKKQLVEALLKDPNSIVILDYSLFDFEVVSEVLSIKSRFLDSSWVFVAEEFSYPFVNRIICNYPLTNFILKDETLANLTKALQCAYKNDQFISEKVLQIIENNQHIDISEEKKLSSTETEIVKLIAAGMTTKEIANVRFLSIHTVMTHRKNIFRKLEVNNIHEMTKYAVRAGLINLAEYYI